MFLLDTNAVISILNEREPLIARRFESELGSGARILISSIVLYELRFGIAQSMRREKNEEALRRFLTAPLTTVPFESEDADHAGEIRAHPARRGTPIGPYDILIAAQARRHLATLVTGNWREFERVPNLLWQDWAA